MAGLAEKLLKRAGMSSPEPKSIALQKRLVLFAAEVVQLSAKLPKGAQAAHIGKQILRSGTAVAANYAEARGAESRSDFIHKLRIVLKELNETVTWLDLIIATSLASDSAVKNLSKQGEELARMIAASIKTAGGFNRT